MVSSVQAVLNLFEQEPEGELLPACRASGTAMIARVPLDSGALTGCWTEDTWDGWAENDKRKIMYSRSQYDDTLRRSRALEKLAAEHGLSLAEMALRYCLSVPGVSTVIPGMRSVEEVELNLPYGEADPLPADLMAKLPEHAWRHSFYGNAPPVQHAETNA